MPPDACCLWVPGYLSLSGSPLWKAQTRNAAGCEGGTLKVEKCTVMVKAEPQTPAAGLGLQNV